MNTEKIQTEIQFNAASYDGILLVDKEQDWTSFDVVAKLRNVFHLKKVGHAGTLDPMATGLLLVLLGKGTKLSDTLMGHDKVYSASMRLGLTTDTQDIWGTVLREDPSAAEAVTEQQLFSVLDRFTGHIQQIPPMYSAIKIKGKKLYEIARKGGEVARDPRPVQIFSLRCLGREENEVRLEIHCSSGTYIRTLCHDIGEALGCGACMSALRRTKIGEYDVSDAHKISEIKDGTFILKI